MPPKTRQRRNQGEVSVHTEHSHAESAVNVQGQDQQQPPPSNQNQEVPPTSLLLQLIQSLQQNQSELAEAIKQLKEKDAATKTPPQNEEENQEKPHQDSGSQDKEATFVTMSDVANLLKQEREKNPKEPRLFVRKPPYPIELLRQPYPEKYVVPTFSRFDGRKGSALVHISKFIDSMGAYAGDGDLCLREFSNCSKRLRKTALSVKPHVEKPKEKKTQPQVLTVSTVNNKRKKPNEKSFEEPPPPVPCTLEEIMAILDKWVADGIIKLPEVSKKATEEDKKNPKFCYFHQYVHHSTADCWTLRRKFHEKIQDGTLELPQARQKVYIDPFLNHKEKGTVSVVIHGNASDVDMDEPAAANSAMTPTAIKALQRNPRFRSLFNQLGLNPEARTAATEAIMAIAADSGAHCFTAETHASRAFLETTNAITFTDEDMEVQYPDHRRPLYLSATINEVQVRRALVDTGSCINLIPLSTIQAAEISQRKIQGAPMEIKGFGGVGEYTKGHIQLVLKVGPIVSLTRFHVVDSVVPYHILLGRPWLHKHQLIPSTYHQCPYMMKLLQQGKHHLLNLLESRCPSGRRIKDAPEADLRDLLERKKKRKAEASYQQKCAGANCPQQEAPEPEEGISQPSCFAVNATDIPESAEAVEAAAADPKTSAKEELETSGTIYEDLPSGGRSSNYPRSQEATCSWFYQANTASAVAVQYSPREEKEWSDPLLVMQCSPLWMVLAVIIKSLCLQGTLRRLHSAHLLGTFYYTVMPFGLKNAGATYQRTMTAMFHDMMHREIEDYVDDIVVKSKTRGDHFSILKKVFERCRLYKLKMNPLKCAFGVSAGKFLGFLVHRRGIDVDPARSSAIATMKPPTTHKELKSFLGKLSYIRRFIPGLAAVTSTFAPLLKKGASFHWSTECQEAFEKVQNIMTKLPTVCAPISGKSLRLYLASNSQAIGALIAQENDNGVEQPIYYVSRTLKDAESRYSGAERSCLALIYASQRLRHYFLAHKVQLMTKSHPIRSLLQRPVLSGRLAQWLLQLSQYEITAETPTAIKSQAIADLLAQFPGEDNSFITDEVPGEINEIFLAGLADSVWTLKFDGSSTATSAGAGIVLYKEGAEAVTKSFKFDFPCSNNAAEYEAYLAGLAIAYEMGIKHLRVIGDSNLVVCQARGEFSLKEPSLAPYRALAQKFETKFSTFEIEHAQRNENRYADALATLGSQITFEGEEMDVTICKRVEPITESLKKEFEESSSDQEDWRAPIKAKLISPTVTADLKEIKDYTLISGDLYRRLPGGVLARCISLKEAKERLPEVHEKTCGDGGAISLYRRLQRLGYFWPNMSAEAAGIQSQCPTCQFHYNNEEVCATFVSADWRTPFLEYLLERILPSNPKDAYRLKRLALRNSCGRMRGTSRKKEALPMLTYTRILLAYNEKGRGRFCENMPYMPNLIGPINPASGGCIWILVATEYFTKWVEAIPLRKATGAAVANFIREHIITRFGIPYKLITDNGTPFINKDVREMLEHYRVKHRRSTPYYPQGNGQAEATNRMLLRILSKMVFDYGNDWKAHLADVLWAYRSSPKTATGFTPFSLVYGTDTISPTELVVPSPRVMQGSELEVDANICAEARMADLEGLDEARDLAKAKSQRNYQKMANVYSKALRVRIFAEGQMVLRAAEFVRRNLPSPSKFSPNWDGPYIIREAHGSGYYRLSKSDGTALADPINGKWLKHYYS
uniref:RNA-directed DNA polymerase n=1 Tax=Fagus sylvatica TaxID=28930 RepID=A0A2N9G6Z1_FAGSY